MKPLDRLGLAFCTLAPIGVHFPSEVHYAGMRVLALLPIASPPDTASFGKPGFSHYLSRFLDDWLPWLSAALFALAVLRLRYLVSTGVTFSHFYLTWTLLFVFGISFYLIPNLIPFFFATIMLALLANTRSAWSRRVHSERPAELVGPSL